MSPEHLALLTEVARVHAGLALGRPSEFHLETRLGALARREGAVSVEALIDRLKAPGSEALARAAAEALAQPDTCFFRDRGAFEALKTRIIPAIAHTKPEGEVRIWSAGCSTGQEAYSLAMMGASAPELADMRLDILATDISERALEKAAAGLFTQFEVQRGLPIRLLIKHFDRVDDNWRAAPRLRQSVRWGRVNLAADLSRAGPFDLILCRNVLSSFEPSARARTLEALVAAIGPGGVLMLGAKETALAPEGFETLRDAPGLYRRKTGRAKAA
jgi:chemotaxis protein methyltransferase CheR